MSKSIQLRAAITTRERERIHINAIRANVPVQEYVATLLRAGLKALNGRGEK